MSTLPQAQGRAASLQEQHTMPDQITSTSEKYVLTPADRAYLHTTDGTTTEVQAQQTYLRTVPSWQREIDTTLRAAVVTRVLYNSDGSSVLGILCRYLYRGVRYSTMWVPACGLSQIPANAYEGMRVRVQIVLTEPGGQYTVVTPVR
jgi:hypothetical protein